MIENMIHDMIESEYTFEYILDHLINEHRMAIDDAIDAIQEITATI